MGMYICRIGVRELGAYGESSSVLIDYANYPRSGQ